MTLKNQWKTVKENWLIALVLLVIIFVPLMGSNSLSTITSTGYKAGGAMYDMAVEESMVARSYYPPTYDGGFAPEVDVRKITKTSSMSTEVERNKFKDADAKLRSIVTSSDSFLLSENVNRNGEGVKGYYYGYYSIKVETAKYDAVVSQLKEIGEVTSFNENKEDVTGRYTDLSVDLEAEKERLKRFKQMLQEVDSTQEKIDLTDRIFNIERQISYYEDSLKNIDNRVDYSTVSVTLQEKQSGYASVIFVKFSQLVRTLVESFNSVLSLLFWALPWAILAGLVWFVVRFVRNRN